MSWIFSQAGACKLRPYLFTAFTNLDPNDITKKRLTVGTGFFTDGGQCRPAGTGDIFLTRHNCRRLVLVGGRLNDSSSVNLEIDGISSWYGPMWVGGRRARGSFVTKNCSNYRRPWHQPHRGQLGA